MSTLKKIMIISSIFFGYEECFSQRNEEVIKQDSISPEQRLATYAAIKFKEARSFNIEYTYTSPYNFRTERNGVSMPESKMEQFSQINISSNVNFLQKKKWIVGLNGNISFGTNTIAPFTDTESTSEHNYRYISPALTATHLSRAFKKPAIFSATVMVDGSDKQFERVKGMLMGSIVLKADAKTKMTVGILGVIDPSTQIPVLPTFSYERKFENGYMVDLIFPKYLYLRKHVLPRGRLSLGAELDRTNFYVYDIDGTSQRYEYRQIDVKSGLVYEHLLGKHFILTAKTGLKTTPYGRLFKKENSFRDYELEIRPDAAFYANVGISFNPLSLLKK